MSSKWKTFVDSTTGKKYYFNLETRVTQWTIPPELASETVTKSVNPLIKSETEPSKAPESVNIYDANDKLVPSGWLRIWDPISGKHYFSNVSSGQTLWVLPTEITNRLANNPSLPPTASKRDYVPSAPLSPSAVKREKPTDSGLSSPLATDGGFSKPLGFNGQMNRDHNNESESSVHSRVNSIGSAAYGTPLMRARPGSLSDNLDAIYSRNSLGKNFTHGSQRSPINEIGSIKQDYEKILDPSSGRFYYHNKITNSTQWEVPIDYIETDNPVNVSRPSVFEEANAGGFLSPLIIPARTDKKPDAVASPTLTFKSFKGIGSFGNNETKSPRESIEKSVERRALKIEIRKEIENFKIKSFAEEHFSTFKKHHFFSSEVIVIDDVIRWQAETIYKNLLKVSNKSDSIQAFKYIQIFMKEYDDIFSLRKTAPEILLQEMGKNDHSIRDEIFCQLIKQTTKNPNPEHNLLGWKLFVLVASAFPCTIALQENLMKYIYSNYVQTGTTLSCVLLTGFYVTKLTRSSVIPPPITLVYLENQLTKKLNPLMFSLSLGLEQLLLCQQTVGDMLPYPRLLVYLCNSIIDAGGRDQQGIFRLAGNKSEINSCRAAIEKGEEPVLSDPNVPADILKQWFRNLPEPIIPYENFDECLSAADKPELCVNLVTKCCSPSQINVLNYLIIFLTDLAQYSAKTSMTVDNLALVFAPGIVRTKIEDPQLLLQYSSKQKQFLKNVIERWIPHPI